jgi:two-component system chemotaxis response regulator CheY
MKLVEDARVLIVDDYATMRRIINNMLQQFGIAKVDHAQNGAEALQKLASSSYDLVLCDWCMETMSGEDFLRAARTSYPGTPVIIVSAHGSQPIMDQARALGAKSFLQKPFPVASLRSAVESACQLTLDRSSTAGAQGLGGKIVDLLGSFGTTAPRRA